MKKKFVKYPIGLDCDGNVRYVVHELYIKNLAPSYTQMKCYKNLLGK